MSSQDYKDYQKSNDLVNNWYVKVVFKGSNEKQEHCHVSVSRTETIRRFAEIVLDKFKIKDVLATVEFSRYDFLNNTPKLITRIMDPDETFWESVLEHGVDTVVYTDAQAPTIPVSVLPYNASSASGASGINVYLE